MGGGGTGSAQEMFGPPRSEGPGRGPLCQEPGRNQLVSVYGGHSEGIRSLLHHVDPPPIPPLA